MSDEAEDPRHETPYKLKSEFALLPILSNVAEAIDTGWLGAYADEVSVLLYELRTRLEHEQTRAVAAFTSARSEPGFFPGLTYQDPAGRFEYCPAGPGFTGESLNTLDLRVMAAHLATALDNVNDELSKRRAYGK